MQIRLRRGASGAGSFDFNKGHRVSNPIQYRATNNRPTPNWNPEHSGKKDMQDRNHIPLAERTEISDTAMVEAQDNMPRHVSFEIKVDGRSGNPKLE